MGDNLPALPSKNTLDRFIELGKTLGPPALALLDPTLGLAMAGMACLIQLPIHRRMKAWLEDLAKGYDRLSKAAKMPTLEELIEHDNAFDTTFLHAWRAAEVNHQQEKLDALRNAVLNAAAGNEPDEDARLIFIRYVDELTPMHVRILRLFHDPRKWAESLSNMQFEAFQRITRKREDPLDVIQFRFKELSGKEGFCRLLWRDLYTRGLIVREDVSVKQDERQPLLEQWTTAVGIDFLRFISEPPQLQ